MFDVKLYYERQSDISTIFVIHINVYNCSIETYLKLDTYDSIDKSDILVKAIVFQHVIFV